MRGKRRGLLLLAGFRRNIPAYAGKTISSPHGFLTVNGTSPRMRGKRVILIPGADTGRNIPAYAGKTYHVYRFVSSVWEHPRVCGENGKTRPEQGFHRGTSPRMRGKLSLAASL